MLHRRIAAGGMATVHLGRLLGAAGFSRTVAIKRLHDGYASDPEFVAMLLDEARLASTIRHPNVVPTLDVVAEQDLLLVVMEYIEGDSLAHLSKLATAAGERVPVNIAAAIVAQSLHGLHGAHEAHDKNGEPLGIVHRDVSPQNVLVGVDGVARVLDFGIAKAASRATSTEDGQLKGKTAYMAPEQLQQGSVDRRTDVFAAAIMLWELLTGRRLFLSDSPAQTMSRILNEVIDPPQRWVPDLPSELSAIALRGLERDPNGRFTTAEEMALAIEDAIALPRAKEIGAWVATVAASTLAVRQEIVREIERESAPIQAASDTDPELRAAMEEAERRRQLADLPTDVGRISSGQVSAQFAMASSSSRRGFIRPTPTPRSGASLPTGEVTDLATVRSSANFVIPPEPRANRLSIVVGVFGALAIAAAIVVVFVVVHGRADNEQAKFDSPPPPPTMSAVEAPPTASAALSASAAPSVASATSSSSKIKHPPLPPPHWGGNTAPVGPPKPDCRIPYVVDDKGLKHFKVECL